MKNAKKGFEWELEKNLFKFPLKIWGLFVLINFLVILFDVQIIKFIGGFRNSFLDYFFIGIGFATNLIIIFFFLTTIFLWKDNKRRWILPLWFSGIVSAVSCFLIKIIIARPRPFEKGLISVFNIVFNTLIINFNKWNFSFPSMHATIIFATFPIISYKFKRFKYFWFIFGGLICFARIYFGAHYLSDVLSGALIGYLIGSLFLLLENKYSSGLKLMKKIKLIKKKRYP